MRPKSQARAGSAKLTARLAVAVWAGFSAMNAQAAEPADVVAAFGNTVLVTYPDGRNQRIWLQPDGSYNGIGRRGTPSSGKWSIKEEKVCLKQSKPFPAPVSYCTPFPERSAVGVTWTGRDISGTPITLKLVKGVEPPSAEGR